MITFTCITSWPTISDNLLPVQYTFYRPGFCVRESIIYLHSLIENMKTCVFGGMDYHLYAIGFQKRGLPHARGIARSSSYSLEVLHAVDKRV